MGREGAFKDRPLWRRLQTIHHEIKEGRFPNTSSLAAELSVSTKTVQRDLDYLRDELEAPIEFRREENGYAYSRDDYVLPFLPVDGADLFAIGVAAQVLQLLGGTPLAQTLSSCYERLARLMPPGVRLRPEIVREMLTLRVGGLPAGARGNLARRVRGPAEGRGALDSVPASGREPRRAAHAPSVCARARRPRLDDARRGPVGQIKNFYLGRIASARATSERYAIPKDFDADAFFRNTFGIFVGKGPAFRFRVRFSPEVSGEIREMVWHPKQKIETDAARPGDPASFRRKRCARRDASSSPTAGTPKCSRRPSWSRRCGPRPAPWPDLWRRVGGSTPHARAETGRSRAPPGVLEAAMKPTTGVLLLVFSPGRVWARPDAVPRPYGPCPIPTRTSAARGA